jgi:hypothetical protein
LGLKYLNSLMRIRDPGWKKVGSGIRAKHPGSATLEKSEEMYGNNVFKCCMFSWEGGRLLL